MSRKNEPGMTPTEALRIEFGVIGLGVVALIMIFQPFALWIFSIGCGLVVISALLNNVLPMAQAGKPMRGVIFTTLIVALVFCAVLLISIAAAALYGVAFLNPPATPSLVPPAPPFWQHPMVWILAGLTGLFAFLVRRMVRS